MSVCARKPLLSDAHTLHHDCHLLGCIGSSNGKVALEGATFIRQHGLTHRHHASKAERGGRKKKAKSVTATR